jgi:hypothetical protein
MSEEINTNKGGAGKAFLKSIAFVLVVLAVYIYIAEVITDISGQAHRGSVAAGVGPEQGREIFFGKGKCSTCHSLGNEGSAIRCPNLGVVEGVSLHLICLFFSGQSYAPQSGQKQRGKNTIQLIILLRVITIRVLMLLMGSGTKCPSSGKHPLN